MARPGGDLPIIYAGHAGVDLPLLVTESGQSCWGMGESRTRTRSDILAIEVVMRGRLRLTQDGRESIVGPGEAFILKRGATHRYATLSAPLTKRFTGLSGALADSLTAALPDHVVLPDARRALALQSRIRVLLRRRAADYHQEASALAYRLLIGLRTAVAEAAPPRHPALVTALRVLDRAGALGLTSAQLAAAAGTSPSHLHRLFQATLGTSPQRHARARAMRLACALLADTTLSCGEIARRIGYADPDYFSAVFRREQGESPLTYRQRVRG